MHKYYEQFDCVGVLPPRNYYVPFLSDPKGKAREQSECFTSLNGQWKVTAYDSVLDVPDNFYACEGNDEITVPSCLQMLGYDVMQYTNVNYPFATNPPYVPNVNPAFHYSKTVNLKKTSDKVYLNFEGVDSCFYLYLNGVFVGFSQISHRVSEFDVTDLVKEGENKIDVLVLKWCAGSYLEDQDKLRYTGIFRDVYILTRPQNHIVDYHITADMNGVLTFTLRKGDSAKVKFGKKVVEVSEGKSVKFVKNNPILWSAETPYLYDLYIESAGEIILEKVGFRSVYNDGKVCLFNGKPIKLLGVNRHDNHPEKGMTVSREDMIADLKLMKELNINCIRTSHYQSAPEFYKMCDEYGFYVVSESDLEGHGFAYQKPNGYGEVEYSEIANRGEFYMSAVQRQDVNILLNFNRPCVMMWSLGNETGFGPVLDRVLRYMRTLDDTRLIHYERINNARPDAVGIVRAVDNKALYYTDAVDMANRMYPSIEGIVSEYFNDEKEFRPYFLCEYCHAMGNGPGDIYEYVNFFFTNDSLMGGCVWEWADHGIAVKGTKSFRYGGDFGENLHDSNFCIDGMVTADRKLKAGSLEVKKAYQPLVFSVENGNLVIESRQFFATECGTLRLVYKNKGEIVKVEEKEIAVEPRTSIALAIDAYQTLIATFIKNKNEVAFECFNSETSFETKTNEEATIKQNGRYYTVNAGETTFIFDRVRGEISDVIKNGKSLGALKLHLMRAPTDNDRRIKNKWKEYYLDIAKSEPREVEVKDNVIEVVGHISAPVIVPIVSYKMTYTFGANCVTADIDYEIDSRFEQIPRIGFVMKTDKAFKDIEFYGRRADSYCDIHHFSEKDVIKETVKDSYYPYAKPQESGSHYDCSYCEIKSSDVTIRAEGDSFSFSAIPYSVSELTNKAHNDELVSDGTYIYLDYFMQGIGSNSCGPALDKKYHIPFKAQKAIKIIIK